VEENEITEGLRGIALAEPPLGFEPDEVATRAARRMRDRRVALGSGLAVVVVAVAAVTFAANATGGGADPIGSGPSTAPTRPVPGHDLTAAAERNEKHLREVLPGVLPHASEFKIGDFTQQYKDSADSWESFTAEARFRDDAGPAYFTLTVAGPRSAGDFEPLAQRCVPHPDPGPDVPAAEYKLPDGKPLRCTKLPQPDGSTVVVEETGVAAVGKDGNLHLVRKSGLDAMHYRTDGSIVGIVNDDMISVRLAEEYHDTKPDGSPKRDSRSRPSLTQQELVALVTDPAFTVG
jgi:hypothetical protein